MKDDLAHQLWQHSLSAIRGYHTQRGAPSEQPVRHYLDPDRAAREAAVLRGLPVAVAAIDQLANPGDWLSCRVHDVPVLLTRDENGALHALINVCRHRGAIVAPENACGSGKQRFVCPYHSWTYDSCGRNVGRPHEADFAHAPRESSGLVELPVSAYLGLVWVVATPQPDFDWDGYFGPLGEELTAMGYDRHAFSPHRRQFLQPSNWKLVLEGNLESYHFQYAHQKTVAPIFHDNLVVHDYHGEHHRIVLPKRTMADAPDGAETTDVNRLGRHTHIIYFFFPATFLLWEGDHINLFTVSPRGTDACDVNGWMLVPQAFHHRDAAHWQKNDFLFWETLDEDFALAASIQTGLRSGANTAFRFGANEFACALFNEALERRLGAVG